MKTAKEFKRIADEKNTVSEETIAKASDWCFERVTELFEEKICKAAEAGCYSESVYIEAYLREAVEDIPYLKKDKVRKLILKRIQKYYKNLGFVVVKSYECFDGLLTLLTLRVWWG